MPALYPHTSLVYSYYYHNIQYLLLCLHTSFLRVISTMSSKPALQPAAIELTRYYRHYRHPCRSCRPHASSGGDMHRKRSNRRSIWFIKTPNHQPQSFGDFGHDYYSRPENQVNLLLLLLQEQGDLASTLETRYHTACERQPSFACKLEKHKLCLLSIYYTIYNYNYIVATGRTDDKPTVSLRTDDNGTPATWTLILSSSKSLTGRTGLQTEGRFSLLEPLEIQP